MIIKSLKFTKFKARKPSKFQGWINVVLNVGGHELYLNSIKYYRSDNKQWLLMPESETKHKLFNIDTGIRDMIIEHINANN